MKPSAIRVVVVDDSSIARRLLVGVLEADGDITVVGEASDGPTALETIARVSPTLATIDLDMPGMNGLELIERVMATSPIPLLVVTSKELGSELVGDAVRRGALAVAKKPAPGKGAELRREVRRLSRIPVVRHMGRRAAPSPGAPAPAVAASLPAVAAPVPAVSVPRTQRAIVGIAASAGGPLAVASLVAALPATLPACIAIVQHLPRNYAAHYAEYLSDHARRPIVVAHGKVEPQPGRVVLAPDDAHLVVSFGGYLDTSDDPPVGPHRPSATLLFRTMARWLGPRGIGVVLSGIGADGVAGLAELRAAGGLTIASDRASSAVYGMPKAAAESGAAARVLPLDAIAGAIEQALSAPSRPRSPL